MHCPASRAWWIGWQQYWTSYSSWEKILTLQLWLLANHITITHHIHLRAKRKIFILSQNFLLFICVYVFICFIHGYFENERLVKIFSLLLALEVCNSNNTLFSVWTYLCTVHSLRLLMDMFVISPFPSTKYIIRGFTYQQSASENVPVTMLNFGKRPFEWMIEEQWQCLLACSVFVLYVC